MELEKYLEEMKVGYLIGRGGINPQNPTCVMIHGAGGMARIWINQLNNMQSGVNLVALDLPGHGNTAGDGFSSIKEYASWLGEVLRKAFDEQVFLMGHSMGGAIVIEAAFTYPDILKGIILVGTGTRLKVAPAFLEGLQNNFYTTVENIVRYAYAKKSSKELLEEGVKIMKAAGQEVLINDFTACDEFDCQDEISLLDIPTLIVCGKEDRLTPPKLSENLHKDIRDSRLVLIEGAGHMVMVEKFEEFNRAVYDFLISS